MINELTETEQRTLTQLRELLTRQQNIQQVIDTLLYINGWTKEYAQMLLNPPEGVEEINVNGK